MTMRATTVRFSDDLWRLLESEAAVEGVSAAQFVRDATVMRIAFTMGRRRDPAFEAALQRVAGDGGSEVGIEARAAVAQALEAVRDPDRLRAVRATQLLDSPAEEAFERPTRLAAKVLRAPVALVSLLDEHRQFFKSCLGLPEPWASRREMPLSHSFCQHAVASREPLKVEDAREHAVLRHNAAIKDLEVIAYLGMPLITDAGHALGTVCVIDHKPRRWTEDDVAVLQDLAGLVIAQVALAQRADGGN
jgi:GAF domain-containing protein